MDDGNTRPGRFETVLGAAFCSVAAIRLPMIASGQPCPESWQWTAAAVGACAMIASMAWRSRHPLRIRKSSPAGR